jgi:hypothetical protein
MDCVFTSAMNSLNRDEPAGAELGLKHSGGNDHSQDHSQRAGTRNDSFHVDLLRGGFAF